MGNCCPPGRFRRRSSATNPKNVTLLLVGLDNAGKTTVAKRLLEEPLDGVVPTVGFSRISLQEKSCRVTIYDLGGGPQIRDIWPRYYADVHGLIFVVDAVDVGRMSECRKVLAGVLTDTYISGKPVLLLANKQDLEGALDEIDIVDRLNVERLVNQQKCPTLVELCSARHFSRKMDPGITNGYKWLLRCVTKDYPSLNNRVLKDLATQEELERIKRIQREERIKKMWQERENCDIYGQKELTDVQSSTEEKHQNGAIQMIDSASLPGQIEDVPKTSSSRRSSRDGRDVHVPYSVTHRCEFFNFEKDNPDTLLIESMDENPDIKNFLVRPKSSGPRLNTSRSDVTKKRAQRRKSYQRHNKTAPSPLTDVLLEPIGPLPKIFDLSEVKTSRSDENKGAKSPVGGQAYNSQENASRSTPGSRRASANLENGRRTSDDQDFTSKQKKLPPLKIINKELILDVTSLDD